jgi:ribonuclease HI
MKYYFDGYTIGGNPSWKGGGFTVFDEEKLIHTEEILKDGFTNNEGELAGLEWCLKNLASENVEITLSTDSMNTIYWSRSGKSKARRDLRERLMWVKNELAIKKVELIWEPRHLNKAGWYNESNFNA